LCGEGGGSGGEEGDEEVPVKNGLNEALSEGMVDRRGPSSSSISGAVTSTDVCGRGKKGRDTER